MEERPRKAYRGPPTKTSKPIMSVAKLKRIQENLKHHPRDFAMFTLGVETAYRAGDLLSLNVSDVIDLEVGDRFTLREQKTSKARAITVNQVMHDALQRLLQSMPAATPLQPLFVGEKRGTRITVCTLGRMVKRWCADVGLVEPGYSAHSLRKTFGYLNRVQAKVPIELLQDIYGHSSARITLTYLAIQPEEIREVFMRGVIQ